MKRTENRRGNGEEELGEEKRRNKRRERIEEKGREGKENGRGEEKGKTERRIDISERTRERKDKGKSGKNRWKAQVHSMFICTFTVLLTGHWEQETLENFDCKFAKNQILVL